MLGFESVKRYQLITVPEEAPLMWLEMVERPNHGFLVVAPTQLLPAYNPQFTREDLDFLGIKHASEMMLLTIVTLRNDEAFTNLKGPIVVNRRTLVAKQCVPANVIEFSIEHPIHALAVAA